MGYFRTFRDADIREADVKMNNVLMFRKDVIEMLQDVINVIRTLDGKVYNVRIKKTIENVFEGSSLRCYVSSSYKKDYVEMYSAGTYGNYNRCGFSIETYVPEGGTAPRFDAAATIENVKTKINELETNTQKCLDARAEISGMYEELNKMFSRIAEIQSVGDYTFQEFYKLNFYIR